MSKIPTPIPLRANWRDPLPEPVFDEFPEYIALYNRAWELAADHIREMDGLPQSPYMDEACCASDIWIWDTCFMALFCKYAPKLFPGVESFRNFYVPLHGKGYVPPQVPVYDPELAEAWGVKPGETIPHCVHIPDNPPLFAWAELLNARMTGDIDHLRKLYLEDQYLQKHLAQRHSTPSTRTEQFLFFPTNPSPSASTAGSYKFPADTPKQPFAFAKKDKAP